MKRETSYTFSGVGLHDLPEVSAALWERFAGRPVWAFYGDLGAGKTTLIQALCRAAGVDEPVLSPTFSLVNEYVRRDGGAIYHFDFYRIESLEEAYDIGYETYFFSGEPCLVEWPERIAPLLNFPHVRVEIRTAADGSRTITVSKAGGVA
ncbi:MAG: tRNA (adenosine(37)-N6)-threonylcarbamoyltransferase complex ATPase subunit type 1 TsaE [Bacteroidales bacterium]|nr:tRNA (adenosine(37)-N6)-threonylcarbamoyltransferase complex ATPase subunit type 1 TsaE [Bacteroidales bacterium]